jgi:hypothetical protein
VVLTPAAKTGLGRAIAITYAWVKCQKFGGKNMLEMALGGFDKLSNLKDDLEKLEKMHIGAESVELVQTRTSMLKIMDTYGRNRFSLGKLLHQYKQFYKIEHGWVAEARSIADALNLDQRTIYRMIESYERAANLPLIIIDEMQKEHIDPAANKNRQIIDNLRRMPEPKTHEEADAAVRVVFGNHVAAKQETRQTTTPSEQRSLEKFTSHIVK